MTEIDLKGIEIFLSVINMMVSIGLWLIVRSNKRRQATSSSIKELDKKFTDQIKAKCDRIAKVETHIASMPSNDHIIRIHDRLDQMSRDHQEVTLMLGDIGGQVKQIARGLK